MSALRLWGKDLHFSNSSSSTAIESIFWFGQKTTLDMGKKGKQAAKDAKKEKQGAKAAKKLLKETDEEVPIQVLVQQIDAKSAQETSGGTEVKTVSPPSARTNFSFLPSRGSSFYIFGGEYFDTKVCYVYRDLFKWSPGKEEEWKLIKSVPEPKPRCGHQAVLSNDEIFVFGGEFATASQFYHFRDFWKFDTKSMTWTEIPPSGSAPSARSGHRMVVCRGLLVLFGGFHDSNRETRYFNDVFVYGHNTWRKIVFPPGTSMPSPRSGVVAASTNDGVFVYGGYAKTKDSDKGAQGVTYQDGWWLDMRPVFDDFKGGMPLWEKIGRKGSPPHRNGCGVAVHKNTVYVFGGVIDEDQGGLSLKNSLFFNDVAVFDLVSKKWSYINVHEKKKEAESTPNTDQNISPDAELAIEPGIGASHLADGIRSGLRAGFIDANGVLQKVLVDPSKPFERVEQSVANVDLKNERSRTHGLPVLEPEVQWLVPPKKISEPLPRMGASVCVKDNHLYVFGGNLEIASSTVVLDDCWRLHLGKTAKWELVLPGSYWEKEWKGDLSSASSDEDELEVRNEHDEADTSYDSGDPESDTESSSEIDRFELIRETLGPISPEYVPRENEPLKHFYERTKNYWISQVPKRNDMPEKRILEDAFILASQRYRAVEEALVP
eukprot:Gregarina_sp_Poly_1__9658@NODE_611_length_7145_cov_95_802063_g467_i0_p1_GENE_NODE_611_length_7145_cov_95_802063_g467_i0NODE_611_length_7145_cov_95_802063_g467_i0_p1_ORF_typecomplete_len660_score103_23Kelch_6/PF13964_6/0_56Kelch_6/PF13964_6/4_2e15Kelch_6/PF13964_6/5_2e07Kelch_6/PF13964_6/0_47Kelch_6/PF13964_6/1_2e06Kelch_6/PF13964_6/5_2e07Kelch_4/PF13418_6/1_1Kelch_4/PF13418_6/1_3e11Kelch_4/PF13418_6/2_7e07Kelch_4/PF13418_6/1_5Kelch_4/PF13418_6/1_9e06Kelch_4/PF13418_6/9_8e06Kelch_3/PF13415_6/1_2e